MNSFTISDDLKAEMAKCKHGSSSQMSVTVSVGKDGSVTISPASAAEKTEEKAEAAPKKNVSRRPKAVMDAISSM